MICNFCNESDFSDFNGRKNAYCNNCRSLERHRCFKTLLDSLKNPLWAKQKVIQFSPEPALERIEDWFGSIERSIYGLENSIDLTSVDREDNTYDMAVCIHVLEHIENDDKALQELVRIVKPGGIVFLMVPAPTQLKQTMDWGYPDENRHGHYRIYGRNFIDKLNEVIVNSKIDSHLIVDSVTGKKEVVYMITKGDIL